MRRSRSTVLLTVTTTALAVALAAPPAAAHGGHGGHGSPGHGPGWSEPRTVADGLAGPLSFDVGRGGTLYVGEAFSGALRVVPRRGADRFVVAPSGLEVGAVTEHHGTLTWARTELGPEGFPVDSWLERRTRRGGVREVVNLWDVEERRNPDVRNTYGFTGLPDDCLAQLPPDLAGYEGLVDSHPYGATQVGSTTYVADAGANVVWSVDRRDRVRVAAVLPAIPVVVTADAAEAAGLPDCVVGATYRFEPVPTDVEVGRHGTLYVTALPGGPEDGSLGANGALFRVDPRTGRVTEVADGFAGATGLAVAPDGTVYVAELFAGRVTAVPPRGRTRVVAELPEPAAVEWRGGKLYVSTQVFGDGEIVVLHPRRGHHRS